MVGALARPAAPRRGKGRWSLSLATGPAYVRGMSESRSAHDVTPRGRPFRNVLFAPLARRGNAAALRRVCGLAGLEDGEVTVVGVIGEPTRLQRLLHGPEHVERVLATEHRTMQQRLDRCTRNIEACDVTTIVDVGSTALTLIKRCVAAQHDLLVVTSDEDEEDRATIKRLMRKTPCPVWLMRPTRSRAVRVLAAIDPEPDELALNESILDIAASIAGPENGEMHVVNAWELFGEATMQSSAFLQIDPETLDEQRRAVRVAHESAVAELAAARLGPAAEVHVEAGTATHVIPALVSREHINVVVMGTVGRTGVSGLVMGNTAEQVIDRLTCSMVTVKPPGFVSPLEW